MEEKRERDRQRELEEFKFEAPSSVEEGANRDTIMRVPDRDLDTERKILEMSQHLDRAIALD